MKISKYLWVEQGMHFHTLKKKKLLYHNQYSGKGYLICTGSRAHWTFEILTAHSIGKQHEACYLLGVVKTKQSAFEYVGQLVDHLYNKKDRSYEEYTK